MRGHDIQQDTIALSQYRKDKKSYYNIIISPTQRGVSESSDIDNLLDTIISKQNALIDDFLETIRIQELLDKLRDLVKVHKNILLQNANPVSKLTCKYSSFSSQPLLL